MKKFIFLLLLLLGVDSLVAYAADNGSHTVNLTVDAPTPIPTLTIGGTMLNGGAATDINFDAGMSTSGGSHQITHRWGANALSVTGSDLPANQTRCVISASSANNWRLVNADATQTGVNQPGQPIKYLLIGDSAVDPILTPMYYGQFSLETFYSQAATTPISNGSCSLSMHMTLTTARIEKDTGEAYVPEAGTYSDIVTFTVSTTL